MAKTVKKIVSSPIGKIAAPILGTLALGPAGLGVSSALGGAAIGSGVGTLAGGGSIQDALLSGGLTYAGGQIGGKLLPESIGSAISPSNVAGPYSLPGVSSLGSSAANVLGSSFANTSIGSALGSYAGNNIADSMIGQQTDFGPTTGLAPESPQPDQFSPKQDAQLSLPGSLTNFSSMDPNQVSSNLATQGVYGGGLGPEEDAYFRNLINRRLVDESGKVDPDLSEINPIEMSYLSQRGLGGSNPTSILEALSKYGSQATA